jgi:outer membrane protein OmpA-like peptidoglycan-associated protein
MKHFAFIFILFYSLLSFGQSKEEKEGDKAIEMQDFVKARNWYLQVFKNEKDNYRINEKLAICFVEMNQGNNALKHINLFFEKEKAPKNEHYYLKAKAFHLSHELDSARIYYRKSDPLNANKKEISKKIQECESGIQLMKTPVEYRIRNINQVNSKAHDIAPKITADFEKMYFTTQRAGGEYPEDIYQSDLNGGAWTPPVRVKEPINSEINDACVGLSQDGQTMYLYKGINGGDIYVSELKGKNWSVPKSMPFNTTHRETSLSVSYDGKTLFFVRQLLTEKGEKQGSSDLFYCKKTASGEWSKSIKLNISTEYDEESPYIHPDGKTLFFSSKGHNSMGGYDIFSCEWNGNSCTLPINLGYPLNTAADERNFVLAANGDYAVYAAEKENGGFGGLDIYFITMPVAAKKPSLTLLSGKITDESTGLPLEAKIIITDNDKNEVVAELNSNAENGEYLVSLPAGVNYGIRLEKELHVFYSENIYLKPNEGFTTVNKNAKMLNLSSGSTVILRNIFFATNSSQLSSSSFAELGRLQKLMLENPTMKIQVAGHTDNVGKEQTNQLLSQKRAEAVKNYLISQGIAADRISAVGFGSTKAIASNDTEEGRSQNRRTTFTVR